MPPNLNRRAERAQRAKETVNKIVPELLRQSPRARHGIHRADLVVDPPANSNTPTRATSSSSSYLVAPHPPSIAIRVQCADTLTAAARLADRPFASKRTESSLKAAASAKPNVTVLNMASPSRPGGGFLEGANSQEEFLCARTTLYPSLWDSFYRLPDLGGIHTPDVLVFRDSTPEANELAKKDRYFVDVITSAMLRFHENRGRAEDRDQACSCGVTYCDRDRELVIRKMKAVLRIAQANGSQKLILGAWGCGAYGNPVKEVAKLWRKVIVGSPRQKRPNAERWQGITDIVFAIPDRTMLREFERAFEDVLAPDVVSSSPPSHVSPEIELQDATIADLISRIAQIEMQMEQVKNPRAKARLRQVLGSLNKDLAQGLANKASQEQDLSQGETDEEEDEFVVSGFAASDGEENSFYNFDENDIASDSSANASEVYEFRPSASAAAYESTTHDEDELEDGMVPLFKPSPQFNPQTGWFTGSIDHLSALLRGGKSPVNRSRASPRSPVLRPDSSGQEIDEVTLKSYLTKYEGTDAVD